MKEEAQLINEAKDGKSEAFGKLYDRYLPKIYRFVFFKIGRKEDAEDVTHHVFLNAWENLGKYEYQEVPFSSWLYRIASNAVIDYYRTWKGHKNIEYVPEDTFAEFPELEADADQKLNIALVKSAILKLEPDQQNVLLMKFVDDLSSKEIAHALQKSEGAIRVIQHRALKQLKRIVEENQTRTT